METMPSFDIQPDESGSRPVTEEDAPKSRRAFSGLKLELTDEELYSPGVPKILLDNLTRAEEDNAILRPFRDRFHECDKKNGKLEERLTTNRTIDVISTGCLMACAALVGYAPALWSSTATPAHAGPMALGIGIVLSVSGLVARVISR